MRYLVILLTGLVSFSAQAALTPIPTADLPNYKLALQLAVEHSSLHCRNESSQNLSNYEYSLSRLIENTQTGSVDMAEGQPAFVLEQQFRNSAGKIEKVIATIVTAPSNRIIWSITFDHQILTPVNTGTLLNPVFTSSFRPTKEKVICEM